MTDLCADDLEIVGFNGTPQVDCGRTLPVLRRRSDGMFCVLRSPEGSTLTWYGEDEAKEFAQKGRWTQLREPLSLPRSCLSETGGHIMRQPMAVHVSQTLLETTRLGTWPANFQGEPFEWRLLEQHNDSIRASCGSSEAVEALMDYWAKALQKRFDDEYRQGHEPPSLKRIADFMLCAARSRPLRWQGYLRFALAQEHDRVRPTFDSFIRGEFSDATWERFLEHIKSLGDVLKVVPASSSAATARSKLINITRCRPLDVLPPVAA